MSIRVKSEELRRYFRNNGVVTEEAAQSIFNKLNIELVTTTDGKVSQDLLDDLVLINATYPQLLRHTTIINVTGSAVDMQPIIDILATYQNKSFRYLTIHKSKGLESEYVILINVEDNLLGLPTKIKDEKILKYVNNTKDYYLYEEERRLFYVALTRTKNKTYIISPYKNESIFIKEIKKYKGVIQIKK